MLTSTFLRRILWLYSRSKLHVLFSETGVLMLPHRRLIFALQCIAYLLRRDCGHLVRAVSDDSTKCSHHHFASYAREVLYALNQLAAPVPESTFSLTSAESVNSLAKAVCRSNNEGITRRFDAIQPMRLTSGAGSFAAFTSAATLSLHPG